MTKPSRPFSTGHLRGFHQGEVAELRTAIEELRRSMVVIRRSSTDHTHASTTDRPSEFVVMPFRQEDLQVVYDEFIKPTIDKCGLDCIRGDDMFGSNSIMEEVIEAIAASQIVIADLTGKNANVFYEVGIAHAMGKSVLLLAQSADDVPFDLRHRRVLVYDYTPRGCKLLERHLEENVHRLIGGTGWRPGQHISDTCSPTQ